VLLALKPIGVGSGAVESLESYTTRLVNGDQEARLFGGEMAVLAQAGEVRFW